MTTQADRSMPVEIGIAIVEREGRVLIGRRPHGAALAGYWEFPGGKCEQDETAAEAACRECLEETGLIVKIGRLLSDVQHAYDHGAMRLKFYAAEVLDCVSLLPDRFRWVSVEELKSYEFPPANALILAQLSQLARAQLLD